MSMTFSGCWCCRRRRNFVRYVTSAAMLGQEAIMIQYSTVLDAMVTLTDCLTGYGRSNDYR